jgi:hypothetical protein
MDNTTLSDPDHGNAASWPTSATTSFADLRLLVGACRGGESMGPRRDNDEVEIEREAPGGQAGMSSRIENYLDSRLN